MAFVYILQSRTTGRFYIGSTNNLPRRLSEHARHHSPFTRSQGPWIRVYQEDCESLAEARRREQEIKNWKSAKTIRALIQSSVG